MALSTLAVCWAWSSFTSRRKCEDGLATPFARRDSLHRLADAALIQQAVHHTKAEQLLGFALSAFMVIFIVYAVDLLSLFPRPAAVDLPSSEFCL